ncbi:MAG: hypothetical protein KDA63_20075, partial [Planctomycetales bacterium]|nr:hypothetical protein [Planctomycetales bacterium]
MALAIDERTEKIERVFVDWHEPLLPAAAAWLIDQYGTAGFDGMVELVVVVPGRRAGRRLLELLVEEGELRGRRPCPPRIVTPARLDDVLIRPPAASAPRLVRELAWSRACAALPASDVASVIGPPPAEDQLSRWLSIASTLDRLHAELAADGLSFADVAEHCRRDGPRRELRRWTVMCQIAERYLATLADRGYVDANELRLRALAAPQAFVAAAEVVLVGIADLPRSIHALLKHSATRLTALVHAPADRSGAFDELGCVRTEAWANVEIALANEQVAFCGGPNEQAAAATQHLAKLAEQFAIDEVVISVPDREVVPRLRRQLGERGVRTHDAVGESVDRTNPGMLLAAVASFLDSQRYPDLAQLVRHPDVESWLTARFQARGETEAEEANDTVANCLTVLDNYYAQHLPFGEFRGWPEDRAAAAVAPLRTAVGQLLGGLDESKRALSDWAATVGELLERVYAARRIDVSRPADRALAEAFDAIQRALETLASVDASLAPPVSAAEALRVLVDQLSRVTVAPAPHEHAVELVGWLDVPLDDSPAAIITGMNEGVVPASVVADPFLPDGFRRQLGMSHDRQRLARDAYLL